MSTLERKIDFAVVVSVKNANPNGDPLNGNRPRINYDGTGELSDVSIKRKIRNRLMDAKQSIFVQSDDNKIDGYPSLRARLEGELSADLRKDNETLYKEACKKWLDVRAFGQVFAYSGKGKGDGVSVGVRGPVSIHTAFSVTPVTISSMQITKSVSGEGDGTKKSSDTMGMKHRIDYGIYVFYGAMNPELASKTGFSNEDSLLIKNTLLKLFENDASSARPEGSMEVVKVFWWEHSSAAGQYSSAKVHRCVKVTPKIADPRSLEDYSIDVEQIPGLEAEILSGF